MAKHYHESFKMDVVSSLRLLKEKGIIRLEKEEIKNVRQLCQYFDISSYTLYKWIKLFPVKKSEINDDSDENIPKRIECYAENWCKAYQSDYEEGYGNCNMLGDCKGFKPLDDIAKDLIFKDKMKEAYKDGDAHESESEKAIFSSKPLEVSEEDDYDGIYFEKESRMATKSDNFDIEDSEMRKDFFSPGNEKKIGQDKKKKEIFNQRYYGWFAGMLGIKGYSNMLVPQLKLTIGNELIRQSGLIDMNKAAVKLKVNGER